MSKRRLVICVALAVATAVSAGAVLSAQQATAQAKPTPQADPHAQMHERGNHAMGFDQDKTTHHFYLYADGGAIEVQVNDAVDTTNRDAIRSHLPHISKMFGSGDFSTPLAVHDTNVPGTKELAALKDRLQYSYVETPAGGRVDIVTTDREALDALHRFLRYQITDHKTGDSSQISKRR
jgi:hypothetical protein